MIYDEKTKNEHLSPLNNIYMTKDGKGLSIAILEPHFWINFCKAIKREDLLTDPRFQIPQERQSHSKILTNILKEIISTRNLDEWEDTLDWQEIPYAPVKSMEEAIKDPHVLARDMVQVVEAGK